MNHLFFSCLLIHSSTPIKDLGMPGGKKVVGGGSANAAATTVAAAVPSGVRRLETSEGASAQRDDEPEEEGEEDLRDGGVPFFVNRGGLPVDEATWERMWKHVAKIHPDGEKVAQRIRGVMDLPKVRVCVLIWERGRSRVFMTLGWESKATLPLVG